MNKIDSFRGNFAFLSNFHPAKIVFGDISYPTSEHLYMALKTLNLDDRITISLLDTPAKAKRYGRKVELRPNWENLKLNIMETVVREKFRQNPKLKEKLINTKNAELEETNWWGDIYWGTCEGVGENNLGKILMSVRQEFTK